MGAERAICLTLFVRHGSRRDGAGVGHRLSGHRESFDQGRRLSPRDRAHWRGDVDSTLRECAQPIEAAIMPPVYKWLIVLEQTGLRS